MVLEGDGDQDCGRDDWVFDCRLPGLTESQVKPAPALHSSILSLHTDGSWDPGFSGPTLPHTLSMGKAAESWEAASIASSCPSQVSFLFFSPSVRGKAFWLLAEQITGEVFPTGALQRAAARRKEQRPLPKPVPGWFLVGCSHLILMWSPETLLVSQTGCTRRRWTLAPARDHRGQGKCGRHDMT